MRPFGLGGFGLSRAAAGGAPATLSFTDSDGNPFTAPLAFTDSDGNAFTPPAAFTDSDGNAFVPA